MIDKEKFHNEVDNANLNDRRLESKLKASLDLARIAQEVKAEQDEFLASKGMTIEDARLLSHEGKIALHTEYKEWQNNNENINPKF